MAEYNHQPTSNPISSTHPYRAQAYRKILYSRRIWFSLFNRDSELWTPIHLMLQYVDSLSFLARVQHWWCHFHISSQRSCSAKLTSPSPWFVCIYAIIVGILCHKVPISVCVLCRRWSVPCMTLSCNVRFVRVYPNFCELFASYFRPSWKWHQIGISLSAMPRYRWKDFQSLWITEYWLQMMPTTVFQA